LNRLYPYPEMSLVSLRRALSSNVFVLVTWEPDDCYPKEWKGPAIEA